jgi:hypothetical protein
MFTIQDFHLSLSTAPEGATVIYTNIHLQLLSYILFTDTSMGHARLICIQVFFFLPRKHFGSHNFPSPSDGSLFQFLSALFITMTLSVEETLIYFGYTYYPNLTHHGASIITKISSATLHANGYRNAAMPTTISSPAALKCIPKENTIQLGQKLTCANSPKELCTQCAMYVGQQSTQSAQCAKCTTVYEKSRTLL